jgi:hypothetical protein
MIRQLLSFVAVFGPAVLAGAAACGGSASSGQDAVAPVPGEVGPADKCLTLANAARTRRPSEPESIGVSHVLVKHAEATNPVEGATRSRQDACLRALEARDKLIAGADFATVVASYSDEPGAKTRAGSIGPVRRADLVEPVADAAFELESGQLSDVVESKFGFHVILRTE